MVKSGRVLRGGPNQFGSKLPSVKFKRRPFILLSVRFSKVTFSTQFTGIFNKFLYLSLQNLKGRITPMSSPENG